MIVIVNGEERTLEAETLADLLERLEYDQACLATAVNGNFVPRAERERLRLGPRDRIEILSPMQGG